MAEEISWVGGVAPSHPPDLIGLELSHYHGAWKGLPYYRCKRQVMNRQCAIVLTFNRATAAKQEHTLKRGVGKLEREIENKWAGYKKNTQTDHTGNHHHAKQEPLRGLPEGFRTPGETPDGRRLGTDRQKNKTVRKKSHLLKYAPCGNRISH